MIKKIIKNSLKRIFNNLQLYTKGEGFIIIILMFYIFPYIRIKIFTFLYFLCKKMLHESYSSIVETLVPYLSFFICLIICIIISSVIIAIYLEIRYPASCDDKSSTTVITNDYTFVSMEDIESWAIKNNLYNNVPASLWQKYKRAKDDCFIKNYNAEFSLEILNKRNYAYSEFVKIRNEIIVSLIDNNMNNKK